MMKNMRAFTLLIVFLSVLTIPLLPQSAESSADWVVGPTYYLKEYSWPARSGSITFYYNAVLESTAVIMDVDKLCEGTDQSGIFMAGGLAAGWLTINLVGDANMLPVLSNAGMFSIGNMIDPLLLNNISNVFFAIAPEKGPRNYSVGMLVPYGDRLGDGSTGYNNHCHGAIIPESGLFLMFFQQPFPLVGGGNWIGDFWVFGESLNSIQFYGIYKRPE